MIKFLNLFIMSTLLAVTTLLVFMVGPALEGKYFPVSTVTSLTARIPYEANSTLLKGTSFKIRQDCAFIKLEWWYGTPNGNRVLVPLTLLEPSKLRGGGWFDWGPWLVTLHPLQVLEASHAYVYHECHPFWHTKTLFYIGTDYATDSK